MEVHIKVTYSKFIIYRILFLAFFVSCSYAKEIQSKKVVQKNPFQYQLYLGAIGGYGSTTWQGLVPTEKNQNEVITISTPIQVEEGGGVWGFLGGYEVSPFFAFEVNYLRYPDAKVIFDELSIYSITNDGETVFNTYTETLSLMGKVQLVIPKSKVRIYSSLGVAGLHRDDTLMNSWKLTPTFGAGFNYHFTDRIMGEVGGIYTAGFGESMLNPTVSFFPFLYSLTVRLDVFLM